MTTATDILTQLEELWESAEPGPFEAGDAIILRYADGAYAFRPRAGYDGEKEAIRVLERAKPKAPEWEAVVASYLHSDDHKREVYFRTTHGGWESETRITYADELVDPVPLVELPEREVLTEAIHSASPSIWPIEGGVLADAVLELLEGKRKA